MLGQAPARAVSNRTADVGWITADLRRPYAANADGFREADRPDRTQRSRLLTVRDR